MSAAPATVAVNLLGFVEHPSFDGPSPWLLDVDGHPFVPTGDGGVVLGVRLGDPVGGTVGEQVVPGLTLVHPDAAARSALTALSCVGNTLTVRTGAAAGLLGSVSGIRGESGRVIGVFDQEVLAMLRPGDEVAVRAVGQGGAPDGLDPSVAVLNAAPDLLGQLGVHVVPGGGVRARVAAVLPARAAGNGVGRPAHQWDVALQSTDPAVGLRLGDLVAIDDLDVRHNVGFRHGWRTVGVVGSGASRQPGHGAGLTALVSGPARLVGVEEVAGTPGLTEQILAARRAAAVGTVTW